MSGKVLREKRRVSPANGERGNRDTYATEMPALVLSSILAVSSMSSQSWSQSCRYTSCVAIAGGLLLNAAPVVMALARSFEFGLRITTGTMGAYVIWIPPSPGALSGGGVREKHSGGGLRQLRRLRASSIALPFA